MPFYAQIYDTLHVESEKTFKMEFFSQVSEDISVVMTPGNYWGPPITSSKGFLRQATETLANSPIK